MSKILEAARRSVTRRQETLTRRQARANVIAQLNSQRKVVAQTQFENAQNAVQRAEEAIAKIEGRLIATRERLAQAQARLDQAKTKSSEMDKKVQKRQYLAVDAIDKAQEKLAKAQARVSALEQVEAARTPKTLRPAGQVESEHGQTRPLTNEAVGIVKRIIGSRRSGCLQPLGGDATSLLNAIDNGRASVGDTFEVRIKGRRTSLVFSVESDGLRFVTVSSALVTS